MSTIARLRRAALVLGCTASPLAAQQRLTLADAVAMAQRQGMQARAAQATRDAARWRDKAFNSRLLPQLSLGGTAPGYNRSIIPVQQPDGSTLFKPQQQTNADLTMTLAQKIPLLNTDLTISSALANVQVSGDKAYKNWSSTPFSVGLRQDILRPNVARWDAREQDKRIEVSERTWLEAREDVALTTTNAFFDYFAAKVSFQNAKTNQAVNDSLYTLSKGRFEVGKIAENDLLQSELALLRARTNVDAARLEADRTLAALRLQLGLAPGAPLDIEIPATTPTFTADTAVAVEQAMRNRASISDAELQDVTARRRIAEAQLATGPGATIQASVGYNATAADASAAYQNLAQAQRFSLNVSVPLVQWGLRHEQVQAAESDRDRAASNARTAREQTAQDAHFAALQLALARRSLDIAAKADTVGAKRFEVMYNRYVIGKIGIDNLYIAQNEKDQALQQYVQSLRGYWSAYYRLRRVTLFDFEKGTAIR